MVKVTELPQGIGRLLYPGVCCNFGVQLEQLNKLMKELTGQQFSGSLEVIEDSSKVEYVYKLTLRKYDDTKCDITRKV